MNPYIQWVDGNGQGRLVPGHLCILLAVIIDAMVCRSNANDAEDNHEDEKADADDDDNGHCVACSDEGEKMFSN